MTVYFFKLNFKIYLFMYIKTSLNQLTLKLLICAEASGNGVLFTKCCKTDSLLYNRPMPHATIGDRSAS